MMLASGGAGRAPRLVATGSAPGRRTGIAALCTATGKLKGTAAGWVGRPFHCRLRRQSAGGLSVKAMVPVKISSLTMKAIAVM